MGPSDGIVGYVFTTGQPLAVSDVAADPRFDRSTALETRATCRGRSSPCRSSTTGARSACSRCSTGVAMPGFGLRDIELAGVFARQAAVAIRASRVERDVGELLRATLARLGGRRGRRSARRCPGLRRWRPRWPGSDDDDGSAVGPRRRRRAGSGRARRARSPWSSRSSTRSPAAPRALDAVPAMTADLPAWSEAFAAGRRDAHRAPRAVGPGRSGVGVRRRDGPRAARSRSSTPGVEGAHPAVGGRLVESVAVERDGDDWRVVPAPPDDLVGPRDGERGDHPRPRCRSRTWSRSASSASTTGATAAGSRPAWSGRSRPRGRRSSTCRCRRGATPSSAPLHELADEAYFRNVLLVCGGEQRRRAELPVAVRGRRLGRGPRRARARTRGSTTRRRRSSSGHTGSTSTSRGAAGRA